MNARSTAAGAALAIILTVGTAGLSRVPVRFSPPDAAMLRLSWKINGVTVEATCSLRRRVQRATRMPNMSSPICTECCCSRDL